MCLCLMLALTKFSIIKYISVELSYQKNNCISNFAKAFIHEMKLVHVFSLCVSQQSGMHFLF